MTTTQSSLLLAIIKGAWECAGSRVILDTDPLHRSATMCWTRFCIAGLTHRAPSAASADDVIADLAFARLAIVDLSDAGQQPMSNEDGRFTMVFNGEIYNSPILRRECERSGHRFRSSMDGEVILHMWETEGPSALQRLNGIFALAMLDTIDR